MFRFNPDKLKIVKREKKAEEIENFKKESELDKRKNRQEVPAKIRHGPKLTRRELLLGGLAGLGLAGLYTLTKEPKVALEIYKELYGTEISPTLVNFLSEGYVPKNYQEYITPHDAVVKKFAKETKFEFIIDPPIAEIGDLKTPSGFKFEYASDKDLFGKEEYWQKPAEYLKSGKGDCEDYANALASVSEAKSYEARVVAGYINYKKETPLVPHWNTEAIINGDHYIFDVDSPEWIQSKDYFHKRLKKEGGVWIPLIMFGKKCKLRTYDNAWGLRIKH